MQFRVPTTTLGTMASVGSKTMKSELTEITIVPDRGLSVEQINRSNTVFVRMTSPTDVFESWDADDLDESVRTGIPWGNEQTSGAGVSQIVSRVDDDVIDVEFDDTMVDFVFDTTSIHYQMSAQDPGGLPTGELPEIEYGQRFQTTVGDVIDAVDTVNLASDHFYIDIDEDGVRFSGSGDTDRVSQVIDVDTDGLENAHSLFGVSVFKPFFEAFSAGETVQISMYYNGGPDERNYPMRAEVESEGVEFSAEFAPRNKND